MRRDQRRYENQILIHRKQPCMSSNLIYNFNRHFFDQVTILARQRDNWLELLLLVCYFFFLQNFDVDKLSTIFPLLCY